MSDRRIIGVIVLLAGLTFCVQGFSLLGPFAPWMDAEYLSTAGELGGPMEIDKGYRWNIPVVTYGFDASFEAHFGQAGIDAVELAVAILNALPPASESDLANYPDHTVQENLTAATSGLLDMKSHALHALVQALGLGPPVRSMYVVRDTQLVLSNGVPTTNFIVATRNFDPDSGEPAAMLGGAAFGYQIVSVPVPGRANPAVDAFELPLNPVNPVPKTVAEGGLGPGEFFTGLTRDDVAGLRHLLHPANRRFEPLLPDILIVSGVDDEQPWVAERPGIDKIALCGGGCAGGVWHLPYVAGGVLLTQQVIRIPDLAGSSNPDILFTARDLGVRRSDAPGTRNFVTVTWRREANSTWLNASDLNGQPDGEGPGIIGPGWVVNFSPLGRYASLSTVAENGLDFFTTANWGAFDDFTNAPLRFGIVTNAPAIPLRFDAGRTNGSISVDLLVLGELNRAYRVEASTNLTHWETWAVLTNLGGLIRFAETNSAPRRFYRTLKN